MEHHQAVLFRRICDFEFNLSDDARPFERRLAQESQWTAGFADRAIDEYRRFVLLACTAGHPVCPSETVDQVWHLHLIYTRSYWQRFCGEVLEQPLHHEPSKGGPAEYAKHVRMYADTLASYRATFDQWPPADIWPDVETRFAGPAATRQLERVRYWRLPKPRWPRLFAGHMLISNDMGTDGCESGCGGCGGCS